MSISSLNNMFSGGNHATLVKKLLGFVQHPDNNKKNTEDDRAWPEKTIKSIIKKIKKIPGALENLETAVTFKDSSTECVTLPRYAHPTK